MPTPAGTSSPTTSQTSSARRVGLPTAMLLKANQGQANQTPANIIASIGNSGLTAYLANVDGAGSSAI
jgi:hypothetical protein